MDDRIQIHGDDTLATTSYGGVLPRDTTESVIQSFTNANGSPINDGTRKPDKAPLMLGIDYFAVPWVFSVVLKYQDYQESLQMPHDI